MKGLADFIKYFKPDEGLPPDQWMTWLVDTMCKYLLYCAMEQMAREFQHEIDLLYLDTIGGE